MMSTRAALLLGVVALLAPSQCFLQTPTGLASPRPLAGCPAPLSRTPALREARVLGMSMMAKGKKEKGGGGGKKEGGGASASFADDNQHDNVKLAKQDTDVKGTDTKSIVKSAQEKMAKTVENTKAALGAIRTGRPSPNILDKVMISYYGAETPLPQVATVQVMGASQIVVEPYEKSILKDIEKAIQMSDLGMTPNNDGNMIRLNIPPLTAETRAKYAKQAKAVAEDGKVAVRNIRRAGVDGVKKLEKDSTISEDESKGVQDAIQKDTDKAIKEIDVLCEAKEKELNKV